MLQNTGIQSFVVPAQEPTVPLPVLNSDFEEAAPLLTKNPIKRNREVEMDKQSTSSSVVVSKKKPHVETPNVNPKMELDRPTARKSTDDPIESVKASPERTSYGYKSRAEFAKAFRKVRTRVYNHMLELLEIGRPLFPAICSKHECPLCISWFIQTAVTPCHPKHCDGKCKHGYFPHTSPYGLKLLKKYHTRIHSFPIHVNESQPSGPEFENAICQSYEFVERYEQFPKRTQLILKLAANSSDMVRLMGKPTENSGSTQSSETESESDGSHRPLIIRSKKNKKQATTYVDVLTSTELAG